MSSLVRRAFLPLLLTTTFILLSPMLFADEELGLWSEFDDIVEIWIVSGKVQHEEELNCWTNYDSNVRKVIKGSYGKKTLQFSSRNLVVGSRYILFVNEWDNKSKMLQKIGGVFPDEAAKDKKHRSVCNELNNDLILETDEVSEIILLMPEGENEITEWFKDYFQDDWLPKAIRSIKNQVDIFGIPYRLINYRDFIKASERKSNSSDR